MARTHYCETPAGLVAGTQGSWKVTVRETLRWRGGSANYLFFEKKSLALWPTAFSMCAAVLQEAV